MIRGWQVGVWLVAATVARAEIRVGDPYQKVIAERGAPIGKMEAGDVMILRYPGQAIRLKAAKVVAIEDVKPTESVPVPADAAPSRAKEDRSEPPAPAIAAPAELPWLADYQTAIATAKEQNRRVLLYFTGSDWSAWCMRMDREILSTAEFAGYAQNNLVLVKIDFPHHGEKTPAQKREDQRLARFYNVTGYPVVIVLDSAGKVLGRLGYIEGGPQAFIQRLGAL